MTAPCSSCGAALPADAAYCPACGEASGPGAATAAIDGDHRQRLQRALGRKYELGEVLGRGGFGEVYSAHDRELDREVAIKALRLELLGSDDVAERFRREARAMAKLRHPHVVPIYALGERQGLAYIIMPRIAGESLRARLARAGPLPVTDVRRILIELASALDAAHAAGVIHRDLKPDNVLLEGDEGRALLTDFGIARPTAETGEALTLTGMLLGTPRYMSPEQGAGERDVDHRSDLYSLGVVAFEMLTGRTPFHAVSVLGLLARQLTEDVPALGALRAECPRDLAAVVTRCLAREPDERWESAAALRAALEAGWVPPAAPRDRVERASLGRAAPEPDPAAGSPVRRFALALGGALGLALVAWAVDALPDGQIGFAPFVAVAAALFVGLEYGQLRSAGLGARDAVRAAFRSGAVPDVEAPDTPERALLHQAGTERAGVVSVVARMPAAERAALGEVLERVDQTVARCVSLAHRLASLDRAIAASLSRIERTPTGAGERGRALVERERDAASDAASRRDALEVELGRCVAALEEVRTAVGRDGASAAPSCRAILAAVVEPSEG